MAKSNPENAGWQRDVSISYNRIGDVLEAGGNLTDALKTYQDSLAIRDRLAKADSNNADRHRDLAISQGRVAIVLAEQGDAPRALDMLRRGELSSRGSRSNHPIAAGCPIAKLEQASVHEHVSVKPVSRTAISGLGLLHQGSDLRLMTFRQASLATRRWLILLARFRPFRLELRT